MNCKYEWRLFWEDALKMQWQGREAINYSLIWEIFGEIFRWFPNQIWARQFAVPAHANDPYRRLFRKSHYINSTLACPCGPLIIKYVIEYIGQNMRLFWKKMICAVLKLMIMLSKYSKKKMLEVYFNSVFIIMVLMIVIRHHKPDVAGGLTLC